MNPTQSKIKNFFSIFGLYFFQVVTGGWIAIVFAHFFEILFGFETFLLSFIVLIITAILVRITGKWGGVSLVILNLFFILVGILLEMYIELAPETLAGSQ